MKTCQACQTFCAKDDIFCRQCGHTKFNLKKIGSKVSEAKMVIEIKIECPVGDEKSIREKIMNEKKFPDNCTKVIVNEIDKEFFGYRYIDTKTHPYICNNCRQVVSRDEQGSCANCLSNFWRKRKVIWYRDDGWDVWHSNEEPKKSDSNYHEWRPEEQFEE